ncbi:MAG: hypothetical protein SOS24_02305 [Clostridia bacterium]|nr:hypothetical protein [Clostridia bacterium]
MKRTYNIPTMKIKTFLTESVVTVSGSESNQTTEQKLNAYINANQIKVDNIVRLTW